MQSTAFLALNGLPRDEISHVDHVAELANIAGGLHALKQFLGLFIEQIEARPCAFEAQIATHDAHIIRHHLLHFAHVLCNQHLLFVAHRALVIPFRHTLVEFIFVDVCQRVFGSGFSIHHSLNERIGSQAVSAVQTRARAFANGIEAMDA